MGSTASLSFSFTLRTSACLRCLARSALFSLPCLSCGPRSCALLLASDTGSALGLKTCLTCLGLLLVRHDVVLARRQGSRMVGWLRLLALRQSHLRQDPWSDAQRESEEERLSALAVHRKTFGSGLDNGQDVRAAETIHVRSRKRTLHRGTHRKRRWYPPNP